MEYQQKQEIEESQENHDDDISIENGHTKRFPDLIGTISQFQRNE